MPFEYDDLTFDNIIESCQKYFAKHVEKGMVCDILAGERGPSCKNMNQIPDVKVFYVRFVKPEAPAEVDDEVNDTESTQVVIFTYFPLFYIYCLF